MFLILVALQACLILYASPSIDGTPVHQTDLWLFMVSLDMWSSIGFIVTLGSIAAAITFVGISSGGTFRFLTDVILFSPVIIGLIGLGVVFTNLANLVADELTTRLFPECMSDAFIASGFSCNPVIFLVAITIGPIAFFYVWTVIEWWRGKDY